MNDDSWRRLSSRPISISSRRCRSVKESYSLLQAESDTLDKEEEVAKGAQASLLESSLGRLGAALCNRSWTSVVQQSPSRTAATIAFARATRLLSELMVGQNVASFLLPLLLLACSLHPSGPSVCLASSSSHLRCRGPWSCVLRLRRWKAAP